MKTEFAANHSMNETADALALERARWAAVLDAPSKPASPQHAAHIARGKAQGFRPVGRFQWLALSLIASAGPR